jgi:hypothetical protein
LHYGIEDAHLSPGDRVAHIVQHLPENRGFLCHADEAGFGSHIEETGVADGEPLYIAREAGDSPLAPAVGRRTLVPGDNHLRMGDRVTR